jgi:hypothetical protein
MLKVSPDIDSPPWSLLPPSRGVIGQMTHYLDHMAEMMYAVDWIGDRNHDYQIAFVDSFLLDFRAVYYFLLGRREKGDAHRYDFVSIQEWQRPSTDATKRMYKLVDFISKHRAHLSMSRFTQPRRDLEFWIGVPRITAEYLARTLLDYIDILDRRGDRAADRDESAHGGGLARAVLAPAGSLPCTTSPEVGGRRASMRSTSWWPRWPTMVVRRRTWG